MATRGAAAHLSLAPFVTSSGRPITGEAAQEPDPVEASLEAALGQHMLTFSSPLADGGDLDPLLERIGDARYVLLGEASHGTYDYYLWRARLSRRLIEEKGFRFIAVEGDWPDCYRVNRYIHGKLPDADAESTLRAYERWPAWMWANWEIVALAERPQEFAAWLEAQRQPGSHGPIRWWPAGKWSSSVPPVSSATPCAAPRPPASLAPT